MSNTHAFRQRIRIGFALVVFLAGTIAFVSLYTLRSVIDSKDLVIGDYANDIALTRDLEIAAQEVSVSSRAYMLTRDPRYLKQGDQARALYRTRIQVLRSSVVFPEENKLLDAALDAAFAHQEALDEAISMEGKTSDPKQVAELFESKIHPKSIALREALNHLVAEKDRLANQAVDRSHRDANRATVLVATLGGTAAILACGLFFLSIRTLRRLERAEAEIRRLNENLEQRVIERTREIEGFAYSIAHDLRGPLRAIAGLGEIVISDYGQSLDETGRDALMRMRNAAIRMDHLINGLLGLARFSYQDYPMTSLEVADVLQSALSAVEHDIVATGATVDVDIPPQHVLANPLLATAALTQFLSNGLKFVPPGVAPQLRLRLQLRGDRVRISVTDNGIGVPPEYQGKIFGMFQRLHTTDVYPGVGVGLTLAQRAAERMGGSVGVRSQPGRGSTFWIELAAVPAPALVDAQRA